MTFLVPFDGSELAEAALVRATEFAAVLDERVLAVTVIPEDNASYARERGWIGPDDPFETTQVVTSLHERVTELCPSADFRHEMVDRYAPSGTISLRIREIARAADASMVFVGSRNAGHMVASLSSVGTSVAADEAYDVVIVRDRRPAKVAKIREASPHTGTTSDFYVTE